MFKRILFAVLVLVPATQFALAHDTWIQKRDGQLLVLRGHDGAVEAYDPTLVKEPKATDVKGQSLEMEVVKNKENATLSPKGNPAIVAALYDSGYWLKTTDGWKKATKREGKGKYDIVESLRSKQWCKSVLVAGSESSKPIGQAFEVVPEKDPMTTRVGDKLFIKVIFEGKPVEGAVITTGGGHASDIKSSLKTDKDGTASVTVEKAGFQMVKASHQLPVKDDPDADILSLAATLTVRDKVMRKLIFMTLLAHLTVSAAQAHSVEYQVENRGVSARFFFLPNDPANYSPCEVFGPGDTVPHQKGRTDKNGVVSFLPDRPGKWTIKMIAESEHGGHAANVEIDVKEGLLAESFSKPLVAAHVKFFVGAGVFLSVFGLWALWTARRPQLKRQQDTH